MTDRGIADEATFDLPNGIAVAPDGTIYVNQATSGELGTFPTAARVITRDG